MPGPRTARDILLTKGGHLDAVGNGAAESYARVLPQGSPILALASVSHWPRWSRGFDQVGRGRERYKYEILTAAGRLTLKFDGRRGSGTPRCHGSRIAAQVLRADAATAVMYQATAIVARLMDAVTAPRGRNSGSARSMRLRPR
jgi:hypothetical protein